MTGNVFVGESMFHTRPNASKYAYIRMCQLLVERGVPFVDNQIPTDHLTSLGAVDIDRAIYVQMLSEAHEEENAVDSPLFPLAFIPLD